MFYLYCIGYFLEMKKTKMKIYQPKKNKMMKTSKKIIFTKQTILFFICTLLFVPFSYAQELNLDEVKKSAIDYSRNIKNGKLIPIIFQKLKRWH